MDKEQAGKGALTLDFDRIGRRGKGRLTVRFPGGESLTDTVDVANAKDKGRFLRWLCKGRKGIDRKDVANELERIAGEILAKPSGDGSDEGDGAKQGRPSQADLLVGLVQDEQVELFHTPGGNDSEGYATITVDDHKETWPVNAKGFRRWLGRKFAEQWKKVPGSQALQDALNVIAGKAIYDGPEHTVAVRVAEHEGAIWLDLANDKWQAVRITAAGWQIVSEAPVKFIRRRGMLTLPAPVAGGRIDELRAFVNLVDEEAWKLFVAWLVAALRPGRPFPVLCVNGEQGSAKSTLCKMARALIDPNTAPLRRPPRDDRDLMIAATNGWVVAFDNLSGIAPALSDALCLLATGGGFGTRELYTDNDEKLFDATRPVMVNGIEDLATRADLLDRALTLTLPEITEEHRRDEKELWLGFEAARPRILGALLDAVSASLKNLPQVNLPKKPRMADFACWVTAAEPALGWLPGAFLEAYTLNRGAANALALETSIITGPIFSLMDSREEWSGTMSDLLAEIEAPACTDEKTRAKKEWPSSSRKFSGELRRIAPNLRKAGVNVTIGKHSRRGTPVVLERIEKTPSRPSPQSQDKPDNDLRRDDSGHDGDDVDLEPSRCKPLCGEAGDGGDGGDGSAGVQSEAEEMAEWTA